MPVRRALRTRSQDMERAAMHLVAQDPATLPELEMITTSYTPKPTVADAHGEGNEWDRSYSGLALGSTGAQRMSQHLVAFKKAGQGTIER
ncbi:unnamed protein product [Jaminaea pallidilutea]